MFFLQHLASHIAALSIFLASVVRCESPQPRPSPGCKERLEGGERRLASSDVFGKHYETRAASSSLIKKRVVVLDFEAVERQYFVAPAPHPDEPAPLLLAFHGQTGDGESQSTYHNFSVFGRNANLMVIYPQGMNDSYPGEEQGTGWNVGSAADNATCVPEGVGDNYGCYKSCRKLKQCGRCNWSTCYNDVLYIRTMLKAVSEAFCIDLDRIYLQGESNGAMMVEHLVREMPEAFAGVTTWFGTPMLGYLLGSSLQLVTRPEFTRTAILALHGRNDTTIPPSGGVSDGGWLFEPFVQATGVWAALHQCQRKSTSIKTKWDGGPLNFRCSEYLHCLTGRRIMQCMYDGQHGDYPSGTDGDQITLWFLLQFSRGIPADTEREPNVV